MPEKEARYEQPHQTRKNSWNSANGSGRYRAKRGREPIIPVSGKKLTDSGRTRVQVDKMESLYKGILDGSPYYIPRNQVVDDPPSIVADASDVETQTQIAQQEGECQYGPYCTYLPHVSY